MYTVEVLYHLCVDMINKNILYSRFLYILFSSTYQVQILKMNISVVLKAQIIHETVFQNTKTNIISIIVCSSFEEHGTVNHSKEIHFCIDVCLNSK